MPQATPFSQFSHATRKGWFVGIGFFLRLALGWVFLSAGWAKFFAETWTATAYLSGATGPFAAWFQSMAGNSFVDVLNIYGQLGIGIALMIGLFVRPAAFFGFILMILYYFAQFEQNTLHGFIDEHVVYSIVFLLFFVGGFGHVWGIDGLIGRQPSLQKKAWSRWLFG